MAENHEAEDINGNPLLTKDEVDRLERFYGKVDPVTKKVRIRRLQVPLDCGGSTRERAVWVWDWGRNESPTEPQFRAIEHEGFCTVDPVLRATLIASYLTAKKSNVAFADLIQQQIIAAAAANSARNNRR